MAGDIQLRLYEELNDSLPPDKRKIRFAHPLDNIRTVKELLSSLELTEKVVELVLVNGVSVDLSHPLHDGDFVSLYPVFESLDVRPLLRVREQTLRRVRFITYGRLLRLAGHLRLLGFDVLTPHAWTLERTVGVAEDEQRIVLTRDPSLLKIPELSRAYLVQAPGSNDQLLEVLTRFDLFDGVHFSGAQPMLSRILESRANSK
jgi:sulfur carrier protein ThiS